MEDTRGAYRVLGGKHLGGKDCLQDLGVKGRIILKWIFKRWYGKAWTGMVQDRDKCQAFLCFFGRASRFNSRN